MTESAQVDPVEAAADAERRLLEPAVRSSPELMASLLHPDFREVGASGWLWDRDSVVAALSPEASKALPITASRMTGVQLATDLVHLTFDTETGGRRAHRSSLWRLTDGRWLLWFHQGTPFDAEVARPDGVRLAQPDGPPAG
ncbi:nuclear transport factor 2 family protein [Streptomyces peucetius]|uniref:Nuclear transport factor 2 family protein n=1 Tax=Streptomyces peucetius TaxID=1950 RepID=A0ABY6IG98_STRPE|nr:nuclear transport factor 2 family protein [Streptomyces peucetius]UYQ65205.1 nuclear transport factor 2 family protein [Streptomyces peucetius]